MATSFLQTYTRTCCDCRETFQAENNFKKLCPTCKTYHAETSRVSSVEMIKDKRSRGSDYNTVVKHVRKAKKYVSNVTDREQEAIDRRALEIDWRGFGNDRGRVIPQGSPEFNAIAFPLLRRDYRDETLYMRGARK